MKLRIDGRDLEAREGETILEAAASAGIEIPVLCHSPGLDPVGVCRLCVVDVGERTKAASCVRKCQPGMEIRTQSEELDRHRSMLTELLLSDQPAATAMNEDRREVRLGDNELASLARVHALTRSRFPAAPGRGEDQSSKVIDVDHQACILCDRCIRACNDVQGNEVIGRSGKGFSAKIAFDLDAGMGESTCVSCGECAAVCPTGALVDRPLRSPLRPRRELKAVDSVCPYCGVGCALTYHVAEGADGKRAEIVFAEGRKDSANLGRLCVKGRYGWDYVSHPQRLVTPLIRREAAYPKGALSSDTRGENDGRRRAGGFVDDREVLPAFREASWDEALDLVASRLAGIRDHDGPNALAGFGSAKCSNEEAYLFQKMMRTALGTNNVDHCTRLCHASSVAALLESIGSGAVTTTYADIENADVALITGSNPTSNHPVAATFFKQAIKRGLKLIVVDPRREVIADHAEFFCGIKPGTDVAFYNAMMQVIIEEGLCDESFIETRTEGFEALRESVAEYTPERASKICGLSPERIRDVARVFGRAKRAIIFWGMGVSQHVYGTNNARCLISLALITGNVGAPGSGLHPLRGQNNVQGASDAGLIPMVYPDYQRVDDARVREKFEAAWGCSLSPDPGLTVVEITAGALAGSIRGMYIMGENPFLSDPNVNKVRKALSKLDFLVVQDIFLTETAEFADVILPASAYMEKLGTYTNTDRRVQLGRPVLELPGQARLDWEIISEVSTRAGYPMRYASTDEIFAEFAGLTSSYATLDHNTLGASGKLWPNPDPEHEEGPAVLFTDRFPTESGRAKLVPAQWSAAPELPDERYPFVLNTGRLLEHWHTGGMTRRAKALDAIAPEAFAAIHPKDAEALGLITGDRALVESRRGKIRIAVKLTTRENRGAIFIPFHFREAAANLLTLDELDPDGKIPEFKLCAVSVTRCED
ncbi:MAG TPA: formate dehydrogenase subunit alpha [Myxococcales bacterium]|nr:formate dehydrogenase subunit alpha [Myxococcales bacterium]HIK83969.1 formate dehydrogenase subunit alpha [Myxococcales bacterium]